MPTLHRSRILLAAGAVIVGAAVSLAVAAPAAAVPGLIVTTGWSSATASESFKWANAVCPEGTVILGGGADIIGGGHDVRLTSMVPSAAGFPVHSYFATAMEDGTYDANWTMYAWAICGSGVQGWQVVSASAAASPGATLTGVGVACPTGKKVIGTGAAATGGLPYLLDTIQPSAALTSVWVEVAGDESTPIPGSAWGAKAFAICINPVHGQQLVSASTAATSADKFISVKCPAGTRLHGTGASLTGSIGEAYLDRVGLFGPGAVAGADVVANEDQTGFAGNWTATTYAICAN
jgi:hypothetical protein